VGVDLQFIEPWPVLIAAVSSFALGGVWYSPFVFGRLQARWMAVRGETAPQAGPRILITSFFFTLMEAAAMAWLLGGNGEFFHVVRVCLTAGLFIAAASSGINYQFTGRGMRLWLIDGGFHVARFAVYAIVLGSWN
jgi:hypothetical protein